MMRDLLVGISIALPLGFIVLGSVVLGQVSVWQWIKRKGLILCTPQDVVEAVLKELRGPTPERMPLWWGKSIPQTAERIAANLIQIAKQKGENNK